MSESEILFREKNTKNSVADRNKNQSSDINPTETSCMIDEKEKLSKNKIKKENADIRFSFKNYRIHFNIISFVLIALGTITYLLSLTGCEGNQAECLGQLTRRYVAYFVALVCFSAFSFGLIYAFSLYGFNNKLFSLLQTFIILYLCLIHDSGYNMKNHGGFNRIFFGIVIILSFIVQNTIFFIIYLLRKKFLPVLIILLFSIVTFCSFFYLKLIQNCNNWDTGLKNSRYDNSSKVCKIKFPTFCWMNMFSGYFDISYLFLPDCTYIRMDSKSQLEKWLKNPNSKVIGFPRTEKKKFFPDSLLEEFQFRILSEIIDMEDPKISVDVKEQVEAIIDFNNPKPEINLRIANNEKLKLERKKIFEKNSKEILAKNVIHFFIDSLSRQDFMRKLKKTKKFLEKFYFEDDELESENYKNTPSEVFQFFKYHAVSHFTYGNMIPTQFGVDYQHPVEEKLNSYLKYYIESGFITGQGHGYCGREICDIERGMENLEFYNFDHEINPIFCDPNFSVPGNPYGIFNGVFSYKRRCLYGKDTHEHIFEYAKLFFKNYEKEAKFFRLAFQDAHEGTGEVVKYMDDKIVSFFEFLEENNFLEDTVIVLHSDHGLNMPGLYTVVDAEDFFIEKTLPTLFLFVPKNLSEKYRNVIKEKQNVFLSPYDLHNTFLHLANSPQEAYNSVGESLFKHIDESDRTCALFKVRDPYCNCIGEGNRNV